MRNGIEKDSSPHPKPVWMGSALSLLVLCAVLAAVLPARAQEGAAPAPAADLLTTKEGKQVSGKITSLQDGKLLVQGPKGPQTFAIDQVSQFQIQSNAPSGEVSAALLQRLLDNQTQMAQRLEQVAVSLANLERQLLTVQSNQQIQARRLGERSVEVNPISRVTVTHQNVVRRDGNTVVEGRVVNQSESVVGNLQVQAALFGTRGEIRNRGGMMSRVGQVTPASLAPGQTGRFEVAFDGFLVVDNFQVEVVAPGTYGGIPYGALPGQANPPAGAFGEY